MIFTSFEFVLFFVLVFGFRQAMGNSRGVKTLLLVASYVFYMSWSVPCVTLIVAVCIVNYWVGRQIGQTQELSRRRRWLWISVGFDLGLLSFFKYAGFFASNVFGVLHWLGIPWQLPVPQILLPVGISFFTFQSLSYVIDVYRGELAPCRSWRDFFLFVSLFPHLVAGPIVRAATLLPQLRETRRATARDVEVGLALFAQGAVKKIVISDQISPFVDTVFATPERFDAPTLWLAMLAYAVQIYCDFSGYTDMAIGCARILGFRFCENFRMPYSAVSVAEFWRRWHISLSSWLRDYLYISLGGNRRSEGRTYINLMITMLLGGLWHGASWTFVAWGALHGVALAGCRLWQQRLRPAALNRVPAVLRITASHALTLAVVLAGWVFFRCTSFEAALDYLLRLGGGSAGGVSLPSPQAFLAVGAVALTHLVVAKDSDLPESLPEKPWWVRLTFYSAQLTLIVCLGASDAMPFIYFQF